MLARLKGQAIYIGREITVTLLNIEEGTRVAFGITVPPSVAVTHDSAGMRKHLDAVERCEALGIGDSYTHVIRCETGEGVYIGRGVLVTVQEIDLNMRRAKEHGWRGNSATWNGPSSEVRVGIDAPRFMAVSRDDFTREQHLAFCEQREQGIDHHKRRAG